MQGLRASKLVIFLTFNIYSSFNHSFNILLGHRFGNDDNLAEPEEVDAEQNESTVSQAKGYFELQKRCSR